MSLRSSEASLTGQFRRLKIRRSTFLNCIKLADRRTLKPPNCKMPGQESGREIYGFKSVSTWTEIYLARHRSDLGNLNRVYPGKVIVRS